MRVLKITLTTIGSLLLILLLAIAMVLLVDLGRFKDTIVDFASDYLERDIAIEGALSIELGRQVRVSAEGLRVASTEWTDEPDLVSIDEMLVVLDTWSTLSGVVLVEDIRASGIRAYLAADDQGNDNWTFAVFEEDDSAATPVALRQAQISDLQIHYLDPNLPPLTFASSAIEINEDDNGDLDFQVTGALNDTDLTVNGSVGPLDNLIGGVDVRFALSGEIGEIALNAFGHIDDLVEPRTPEIEFDVRGPNAEYLTGILDIEPVTTGPLALTGSVEKMDGGLNLRIDGTFGEFDIDLNAGTTDLMSTNDVNIVLLAKGPSAATIARLAGQEDFPALPFSVDAALARSGESVIVERLLVDFGAANLNTTATVPHFPGLEDARVHLTARGPEFGDLNRLLGLPGRLTGPFEINVDLLQSDKGGALDADLVAKDLQARVSGDLTEHPELIGSRVTVEASGADLSVIAAALGTEGIPALAFAVRADLGLIEQAVEISSGAASVGKERLGFHGRVGLDPFSEHTDLSFSTSIENVSELLADFEIEVDGVPEGILEINGEIGRTDGAFTIKSFVARLAGTEASVTGQIGDSLILNDMQLALDLQGDSLAAVMPIDSELISDASFHIVSQIGFSADDQLKLTDLEAQIGDSNGRLTLTASLSPPLESGSLTIEAAGPSLSALVPAAAKYMPEADAFSVRGGGRWQQDDLWMEPTAILVGEAAIDVQGELHAPPNLASSAMTLSVRIPDLKSLQFLTDQSLPDGPFSAQAIVSGSQTDLELKELRMALGPSNLNGTASFRPAGKPDEIPEFSANIRSDHLDLRHFQATTPSAPAEPPASDSRLIPDTPIPLDALRQINGSVDFAVQEIVLQDAILRDVSLIGNLANGALRVDRFTVSGPHGGALSGSGSIVPNESGADITLNAGGSSMVIGLPAETEEERLLLPTYDLRTEMRASGATIRQLAATSTGYLRVVAGEGKLALSAVGFLTRDFASQVLNAVNPLAKKEPHAQVQCIAVLIEAIDGVVIGRPALVFQSNKLNITGVGKVDLKTEKLNAKFSTQARKGIGIGMSDLVSPLTEIGGTLASPTLQLNAKGVLIEGGAAVATLGVSFLAKKARDRLFSNKNPCQKAIQEADADLESRKSG